MAITHFVPEIWSAQILVNLRNTLVYGQAGVINRNYEGDIAQAGDTVHITHFADPTVRKYSKDTDISVDVLTDGTDTLTVDQSDYFAFEADDIDRRQALAGFVQVATVGASYNLAAEADTYIAGKMVSGAGTKLGRVVIDSSTPSDAYDLMVQLRTALAKEKGIPTDGRWVVVPPDFYAVLLHDERFIKVNESGTDQGLRNAQVGRIAGFTVMESNTVPTNEAETSSASTDEYSSDSSDASESSSDSGDIQEWTIIAGHPMATTFAEQIASIEAVRVEKRFADMVKGLHLYGGAVIRPTGLVTAQISIS